MREGKGRLSLGEGRQVEDLLARTYVKGTVCALTMLYEGNNNKNWLQVILELK